MPGARHVHLPGPEDSVADTVASLGQRGYDHGFELVEGGIRSPRCGDLISLADLEVDEVHRFEGVSDPADEAIVVALRYGGWRGTLVAGYGLSTPPAEAELLVAMALRRRR